MQFRSREDIEAPIDFVFEQVTDFQSFERQALRRGADVRRKDSNTEPGVGSAWDVVFEYRGKDRRIAVEVVYFDAPNSYLLKVVSGGLTGETLVDLVALSRRRTRLTVLTEMSAQGLSARLLLQSMKLAKGNISKRLDGRISTFAADVEERFARQG